jgi:transcriptional regulator with PAS, ATPase and Fis domain
MSSLSERQEPRGTAAESTSNRGESLRKRVRHAARQIESSIIREALEQHHWNRRRTAEALNISYRSLMYKMKACNLRDNQAMAESQGD